MKQPSLLSRPFLLGAITPKHTDLALLCCSFVTGLLDCAAFNNWSTFVGMQTGNTVILALSSASLPASAPYAYLTTSVSLASFCLGAFLAFRVATQLGKLRRPVVAGSFLAQALLIVLAAALTSTSLVPKDNGMPGEASVLGDVRIVAALPPLAFQSGMTIAASRMLGFNELPVNVLTSTYADLAGDPGLFAVRNRKRDRRLAAVVSLVAGALVSAWMMKKGPGIVGVLWLAAGIKVVVGVGVGVFAQAVVVEEVGGEQSVEKGGFEVKT